VTVGAVEAETPNDNCNEIGFGSWRVFIVVRYSVTRYGLQCNARFHFQCNTASISLREEELAASSFVYEFN
jgi:hypothetical protein